MDASGKVRERKAYISFHHEDLSQLTSLQFNGLIINLF